MTGNDDIPKSLLGFLRKQVRHNMIAKKESPSIRLTVKLLHMRWRRTSLQENDGDPRSELQSGFYTLSPKMRIWGKVTRIMQHLNHRRNLLYARDEKEKLCNLCRMQQKFLYIAQQGRQFHVTARLTHVHLLVKYAQIRSPSSGRKKSVTLQIGCPLVRRHMQLKDSRERTCWTNTLRQICKSTESNEIRDIAAGMPSCADSHDSMTPWLQHTRACNYIQTYAP